MLSFLRRHPPTQAMPDFEPGQVVYVRTKGLADVVFLGPLADTQSDALALVTHGGSQLLILDAQKALQLVRPLCQPYLALERLEFLLQGRRDTGLNAGDIAPERHMAILSKATEEDQLRAWVAIAMRDTLSFADRRLLDVIEQTVMAEMAHVLRRDLTEVLTQVRALFPTLSPPVTRRASRDIGGALVARIEAEGPPRTQAELHTLWERTVME